MDLIDDMNTHTVFDILEKGAPANTQFYGYVRTSVVGIQHAPGAKTISTPTWMVLCPEPENKYDSNAMRVDTMAGSKVGYINRAMAKKVSEVIRLEEKVVVRVYAIQEPEKYDLCTAVAFYGPENGDQFETIAQTMKCGTWSREIANQPPAKKRKVDTADEAPVDPTKKRLLASLVIYNDAHKKDLPFKSGYRMNLESAMEEYRKHHDPVEPSMETAFQEAISGKSILTISS
jgi:L-rhamnose mutarotase